MNKNRYKNYLKPELAKLLEMTGLDKEYYRAQGDYLFYKDSAGNDVKVIDFIGGYGASLFGHNNSELSRLAVSQLNNCLPFNAQASIRSNSARLGEKLNNLMFERTGKENKQNR